MRVCLCLGCMLRSKASHIFNSDRVPITLKSNHSSCVFPRTSVHTELRNMSHISSWENLCSVPSCNACNMSVTRIPGVILRASSKRGLRCLIRSCTGLQKVRSIGSWATIKSSIKPTSGSSALGSNLSHCARRVSGILHRTHLP